MPTRQELEAMALEKIGGSSRRAELEKAALAKIPQPAAQVQDQGVLSQVGQFALEKAAQVGSAIDRYTGAPVRSAIGAAQEGENPLAAYGKQFGEEPGLAPTGKQIVEKLGVSDKPLYEKALLFGKTGPSTADIAGIGLDIVADPLTFIPIGQIAKVGAGLGGTGLGIAAKTSGKALKGSAKAADILTGTKVASSAVEGLKSGVETASRTGKAASNVIQSYFKPKIADDFESLKEIAVKNNIDPSILPESVEFGEGSFISRASRAKAEGPLGQPKLEQYKEAQNQINNALNKKISSISGVGGPLSEMDAGALIRSSYDDGVDRFFSQMDTTYGSLAKKYPNLGLDRGASVKFNDALSEIQSNALKRFKNPINAIEKAEARNILTTVDSILKSGTDFQSSVDLLQRIGKYNFKPSTLMSSPIDAAANRRLYGQLKDAIIKTVEKVDPVAALDLVENNKALAEFFGEQSSLAKTMGNKSLSNEGLFKNLIQNGDSKKIDALSSVLSPEQMSQLKASFIESLSKRNDEGLASFRQLQNQLRNKSSVVSTLFNENEIKEISDILKLGNRMGSPVLSSSGTSAGNVFSNLKDAIPNAIVTDQVIERMKSSARGLPSKSNDELNKAIDSLKGLTNEQVINKINKEEKLKKLKAAYDAVQTRNPRSKAAQVASTQETNNKKD